MVLLIMLYKWVSSVKSVDNSDEGAEQYLKLYKLCVLIFLVLNFDDFPSFLTLPLLGDKVLKFFFLLFSSVLQP